MINVVNAIIVSMHIHIVPNRNSKPAVLLRESYRVGGSVRKRTLANLSKLREVLTLCRRGWLEPREPQERRHEINQAHDGIDALTGTRSARRRIQSGTCS